MFHYQINPESDVPIYRQLVDQINAQIRSGALKTGTQLPTVREMADKLHLSCGTVKHVYDCLQEMGDIEMTRRRGTFVKYVKKDRDSRKQQAMNAIDHMIRKLSELNFSPAEIQIFLNLKMREWGLKWSGVRIAVITECMELAPLLQQQLAQIANAQINVWPLRQVREYPYSVDEQSDVILCTVQDAQKLALLLPDSEKLVRIALNADAESIAALATCSAEKIGIVCESPQYASMVKMYLPPQLQQTAQVFADDDPAMGEMDALIAADRFEEQCSPAIRQRLTDGQKPVFHFAFRLDEGSMLYLEEHISRIRDQRQLWPNAMRI